MPSFTKRHGRWEIRFKKSGRTPKEKSESLPIETPVPKVRHIEGKMNAAYHDDWDPWDESWSEYQRRRELDRRGIVSTDMTISEAVTLYIREKVMDYSLKTDQSREWYKNVLDRFACHVGKQKNVATLVPHDAGEYLAEADVSDASRAQYGTVIGGFYDYLVEGNYIESGYAFKGGESTAPEDKIKYLTEGEKNKMVGCWCSNREELMAGRRALPDSCGLDDLINVLFYQGFRFRSEIADRQVTRRDIDLGAGTITVTGKGRKTRRVIIVPPAAGPIKKIYNSTEDPTRDLFPFEYARTYRLIKAVATKALGSSYDWVSPHTFRHSCGTYWVNAGVPLGDIKKLLGHESITTTEIYSKVIDRSSRQHFQSAYDDQARIYRMDRSG